MARVTALNPPAASRFSLVSFLQRRARYIFIAPALIALIGLTGFPILYTVWMSLHNWQVSSITPPEFIGLENYAKILTNDRRMQEAVLRTLLFTLFNVGLQTVLGVTLAMLFNRAFWGRGFLRTLAILPMVTTPVAISLIFVMMMHPTLGVLNYFLSLLGLKSLWIYDQSTVLLSLALVDTWQWTPLIMLIALAALATLPLEPYEAARIDGASGFQILRLITLPLIRPAIVVAIIFRAIDSLKTFDIIFVMTSGGPGTASETLNIYLFNTAFSYFDMGYASAIVVAFFSIILGVVVLGMRFRRRQW